MTPRITSPSQLDPNQLYTYADYQSWEFEDRSELMRGQLWLMPAPRRVHQEVSADIHYLLKRHLQGKKCRAYAAPFDVRLVKGGPQSDAQIRTVVQPDICVVCDPAKLDDKGCIGAPDLVVEIISPGSVGHDTRAKFALYEENGVLEYWLVAPGEKSVTVFVLDKDRYEQTGEYYKPGPIPVHTLPGLTLEWDDVFAGV